MTGVSSLLFDPDMGFLRLAFLTATLASIAFGAVGSLVVARRISYVAGGISHSVLAGIGLALYLRQRAGMAWLHPMLGAVAAALLSAALIAAVGKRAREREDALIGAIWSIGMAIGLLFMARTPGYVDAMSYLFGNILLISRLDLWLVLALDGLVLFAFMAAYRPMLAVSFDEEFARTRGVKTERYGLLLLTLTALTVVLLLRVVGIVMVVALLTLPASIAGRFARRLEQMIVLSIAVCMVVTVAGLLVSFKWDLPSGPTIVGVAGALYLAVALFRARTQ